MFEIGHIVRIPTNDLGTPLYWGWCTRNTWSISQTTSLAIIIKCVNVDEEDQWLTVVTGRGNYVIYGKFIQTII
jgi:hypothetical protein